MDVSLGFACINLDYKINVRDIGRCGIVGQETTVNVVVIYSISPKRIIVFKLTTSSC